MRGKTQKDWQEQEQQEEGWANSDIPVHVPPRPTPEDRHELHQGKQQEWQEQQGGNWADSSEFELAATSTSLQDNYVNVYQTLHNANNATYYSSIHPQYK